jgi:nucleoid-associated protein YgaU
VIDATEERRPPHFHVAVFPAQYERYVDARSGPGSGRRRASQPKSATTYKVRQGDSLWTIARRHGVSVTRIKEANGLSSSRLSIGQRIVIPSR